MSKGLGKTAAGAIGGAIGAGAGEALDPTKKAENKSPLKTGTWWCLVEVCRSIIKSW